MIYIINIGDKFGLLTVLSKSDDIITKNGTKYRAYICQCECGNIKVTRGVYLENGYIKSCGCLNKSNRNSNSHKRKNDFYINDNIVYVKMSNSEKIMMCDYYILEDAKHYTLHLDDRGYASARINGKLVRFHRYYFLTDDSKIIDHIDRNKLNNLKVNIREVSYVENNRNVDKKSNNTTGYKGVSYDKRRDKFYSYINISSRKRKFLGYFNTAEEANHARIIAENEYFN